MSTLIPEGAIGVELVTATHTIDPDGFETAILALAPQAVPDAWIQVHVHDGRAEVYRTFTVVETVTDEARELTVEQALLLDDEPAVGEEIGVGQALDPFVEAGLLQRPTWLTPRPSPEPEA
jgi:hypothetical protein